MSLLKARSKMGRLHDNTPYSTESDSIIHRGTIGIIESGSVNAVKPVMERFADKNMVT